MSPEPKKKIIKKIIIKKKKKLPDENLLQPQV
jgi:hypothetical protein